MPEPPRPQQPTPARAEVASVEWLFEPFWPGDRLIVRLADGAATVELPVTDYLRLATSDTADTAVPQKLVLVLSEKYDVKKPKRNVPTGPEPA